MGYQKQNRVNMFTNNNNNNGNLDFRRKVMVYAPCAIILTTLVLHVTLVNDAVETAEPHRRLNDEVGEEYQRACMEILIDTMHRGGNSANERSLKKELKKSQKYVNRDVTFKGGIPMNSYLDLFLENSSIYSSILRTWNMEYPPQGNNLGEVMNERLNACTYWDSPDA